MHDRPLPETTLELTTPMPAPHWALLERQLMAALPDAIEEFYATYFDERGYLLCYPRWGALDGPDDAAENVTGWTELYALGGPERVLELYRQGIEGHMRQYTEARTVECPLARDGMYYKEFPTSFDFVHNAEGFHGLFQQGLAEPWDPTYRARMRRYAGFYMNEEPGAANYDPEHRLIRSVMTGSRGPVLRRTTPIDWGGDPFECEGRFTPLRWHRTWQDYVDHFSTYQDVTGDTPCNLAVTVMALNAYLCTGDRKYRDWILEYADAWVERADANGGLIPSNVGLDGTIGGGTGGRWWGGVYGWDHKAYFRSLAPYGFGNALLVSGDQRYVDVWRRNIQAVSAHAKEIDGTLQYPQKRGDDGWYEFTPEPYDHGALEVFYWSMEERDRALARREPWGAYLSGDDPTYPVTALAVNAFGVRSLARAAAGIDATLVHYGTDFVFDGTASEPYGEDDPPNPQSVYATSKLLGEWFAQGARHYVLRVESLFGGGALALDADGRRLGSSLDRIADALLDGREVRAFTDRVVSPSYVDDVAAVTLALVRKAAPNGLYHCVGSGHATWFDVTVALARQLGVEPAIQGITLDELKLRAPRPRFCALSNRKLAAAGIEMPHWREAVARYARARRGAGGA